MVLLGRVEDLSWADRAARVEDRVEVFGDKQVAVLDKAAVLWSGRHDGGGRLTGQPGGEQRRRFTGSPTALRIVIQNLTIMSRLLLEPSI